MEEKIKKLREEGKTYAQIADEIPCSISTVNYYLTPGRKESEIRKSRKYKASNPIIKKMDGFNRRLKKVFDNQVTHFQRRGQKTNVSIKSVIEKFGENPICYLTGTLINFNDPLSYSFDHIIPFSRGGDCSLDNLGLCRRDVNQAKSDKTPEEFIQLCKEVLTHAGYIIT